MRITTGAVFIIGGLLALAAFPIIGVPMWRAIPCAVLGVTCGLVILLLPSPELGSPWNHALLIASYSVPAAAFLGALPDAAASVPAFTFAGILVPFRLTNRRHIAAHLALSSVPLVLPVVLGLADARTGVAVGIYLLAMLALTAIVVVVLEAADGQGEHLEELIRRDPLTGVGNRRLLGERLDYELARHGRSGKAFVLLALDLNGFKQVNDTLGHAAGDELLVAVAQALRSHVRAQDTVARQGGDEFCVLLPETSTVDAAVISANLRDALRAITATTDGVSTGIGVAEYPRDGTEADPLLRVADDRLRADKQPGTAAR